MSAFHSTRLRPAAALTVAVALTLSVSGCSGSTSSADFPVRTIELVVPYPAGSGTDLIARTLVDAVNKTGELDKDVQVVNVDGGNGTVGTAKVLNGKADGYTVALLPDGPFTLVPHVEKLAYDPEKADILTGVATGGVMVVVSAKSPYRTLDDLIEAGKKSPDTVTLGEGVLNYAVPAQLMEDATGAKFKGVPIESDAASTTALLGGNLDAAMMQLAGALPQIKGGKLRSLGIMTPEPSSLAADIPTFASQGVDLDWSGYYAVMAPDGLPDDVESKLQEAFASAVSSDEFGTATSKVGIERWEADGAAASKAFEEKSDKAETILSD